MARLWTLALILICLTILTTLITAFRVRDLPKSSQDSARKQETCDNCDVKFVKKWQSSNTENSKYYNDEPRKQLREKRIPIQNIEEVKSSGEEEETDEDGGDFSFLTFKTGLIKEYPKEALNKLEQKLEIISKSFWNLFGDEGDDKMMSDNKDDDGGVDNDDDNYINGSVDDDYEIDDVEERLKIPSIIGKPKITDLKKNIKLDNNIKHNVETQSKASTLKYKSEILKQNVHVSKKKSSFSSKEYDDDNDGSDMTEEKIRGHELKTAIKDVKKTGSSTAVNYSGKSLSRETSAESKYDHNRDSKVEGVSKQSVATDHLKLKFKDSDTISSPIKRNGNSENIDDISDEQENTANYKHDYKGDSNQDKNFLAKESINSKESFKVKNTEKHTDIKVEQSSKEIKDSKPLNIKLTKKDNLDNNDSIKDHSTIFLKTQPDKIKSSKEVTKTEIKQNMIKKEVNTKINEKFKAEEKSNLINNVTPSLKGAKNQQLEQSTQDKGRSKKETSSRAKTSDGNKLKLNITHGNKLYEAGKITKSIDTTKQKLIKDELSAYTEKPVAQVKEESNLKHTTDALHRRRLHKTEFEDFYTFIPTFAPNFSRVSNPECRRHGKILLRQLRGAKLWALNILDATAKIPSGLLQGNGIQLGNFEQCLASRARVQLETGSVVKIQGKYCLAWVDVKAEHPNLETPVHLAQAKNLVKGRIDDPGHFVPRFSTLSWGICVPSPCEPEDVEIIFRDAIRHYQHTSGMVFRIEVNEQDCRTEKGPNWWEKLLELPSVLTLSFYGLIIVLVCVATIQDFVSRRRAEETKSADEIYDKAEHYQKETKTEREDPNQQSDDILSIFSLYRTMEKLTAPGSTDEIPCIHGVRALATIALLVAHKFLPVATMPFTNRLKITETVSSPLWSWCRAGWVFTDCFLLLSGTLSAYRIGNDTNTGAPRRLLSRYLRLTPAMLAVVLFYAYVWDNIASGPMWGTFVTKNSQLCQEGWWWNLLYVQNYFGFENMCAPQTHQLALDMQLTILGCIIVWLVQEKGGFTKLLLPAIHVLAAYSRYSTVRDHRLTLLAYRGVSVSQLYRTARLSYTSVLHRSTPYLVGISLGLTLKKPTQHGRFILTVGWIASTILWSLVWWAGFDSGTSQYRYNATSAAQYAALTPIVSALAISWVIYAVHNGCSEFLSEFFCSRPLVIISRLSYAIYLCQFIIFITSIGTVKTSSEFTVMSLFNVQEISAIILLSAIITLSLVIPMQSLPKFIFQSKFETFETKTLKVDDTVGSKTLKDFKRSIKDDKETPRVKPIQKILVHREVLKEIPEVEIEYEAQRDKIDTLEEILEEEENEEEVSDEEYSQNRLDHDMVIVEEQADEESWRDRDNGPRFCPRDEDNEFDEWEWTANNLNGAQYLRYPRRSND